MSLCDCHHPLRMRSIQRSYPAKGLLQQPPGCLFPDHMLDVKLLMSGLGPAGPSCRRHESSDSKCKSLLKNKKVLRTTEATNERLSNGGSNSKQPTGTGARKWDHNKKGNKAGEVTDRDRHRAY